MTIKYQPFGIQISSSFAVTSSIAVTVGTPPISASFAEYVLSPPGPTGSSFKTITGTTVSV